MVYHPGKVLKVFPPKGKGSETAATVRFWDNNLHTVRVSRDVAGVIQPNNMVLVDYYPMSEKLNRPRMLITNIVSKEDEEELWKHYQSFLRMKKKALEARSQAQNAQIPPRSNVGVG